MKDERLDKMNQEYHEIFIPAELRQRVETGIREAKKRYGNGTTDHHRKEEEAHEKEK